MKLKHLFFVLPFLLIVILIARTSFAQLAFPFNAVPQHIGHGARAMGQAGAFIPVADDVTAAAWNPGALAQLERPELSVVGSFISTEQKFSSSSRYTWNYVSDYSFDTSRESHGDLNYAGVAYPFMILGKKFVAGLNYQKKFDLHLDLSYKKPPANQTTTDLNKQIDFESKGGIAALTPAISMRVIPQLSIGVAVNFFRDELFGDYAWREKTRVRENDTVMNINREFKDFDAINVSVGLLLDVWRWGERRLTFGAVYHAPYTARVDHITETSTVQTATGEVTSVDREKTRLKFDFPRSAGAGFGFYLNRSLSFALDATWTNWTRFMQENENGDRQRPFGGKPEKRSVDDTYAVRLGTQYLIFREQVVIPVRGGIFYDPRSSIDWPIHVYGFSFGSGITFRRFSIDGAYQFRRSEFVNWEDSGINVASDYKAHLFLASLTIFF
jgi:long-subunit fatty acid transport protein